MILVKSKKQMVLRALADRERRDKRHKGRIALFRRARESLHAARSQPQAWVHVHNETMGKHAEEAPTGYEIEALPEPSQVPALRNVR